MKEFFLSISIILLAIISPPLVTSQITPFFTSQFNTQGVYEHFDKTGYSPKYIDQQMIDVQNYIANRSNSLDGNFFNNDEISHLRDVSYLFRLGYAISALCVAYICWLLLYFKKVDWQKVSKITLYISTFIAAIIIIPFLVNFDRVFITFHQLMFLNDNWSFDPTQSNLINMLPQIIFYNFGAAWIVISTSLIAIFIAISKLVMQKMHFE